MTKNISQREARAMRAELKRLRERDQARNARWARDYPGGVNFATITVEAQTASAIRTCRLLDHAVVALVDGHTVRFYGIKP